MKNMAKATAYVIAFCLILGGCAGREFPTATINEIRPNVTTKGQIFATFGEPAEKGLDTGFETWSYYRYVLGQAGGGKQLRILFNTDGTVRNYAFSSK